MPSLNANREFITIANLLAGGASLLADASVALADQQVDPAEDMRLEERIVEIEDHCGMLRRQLSARRMGC